MKSLLSVLALGFCFSGSYVFAAPAKTSAVTISAPIPSSALEANPSTPTDVEDIDDEIDLDEDIEEDEEDVEEDEEDEEEDEEDEEEDEEDEEEDEEDVEEHVEEEVEEDVEEDIEDDTDIDADALGYGQPDMKKLQRRYRRYMRRTLKKRNHRHSCTLDKVQIRKEWGSMSRKERIGYTNAVKCLYKRSPPLSNPAEVPGARNRLDDFVGAHIQQRNKAHFNGYLFAWHRNFVWLYDKALRSECGYKGPTPYWDWTLYPDDPRLSPVFDGSDTSMSGNGESIPHGGTYVTAFGLNVTLPPGTGGGCVKSGPFVDLQVNLGMNPIILPANSADLVSNMSSVGLYATAGTTNLTGSGLPANSSFSGGSTKGSSRNIARRQESGGVFEALKYNPRCLTRDLNLFWSNQVRTKDVEFLLGCDNVDCLEKRADGWELDPSIPQPLLHAAGHFIIGGLENDPFASAGDPAFYLHHAAFDRLYSIWQAQDAEKRLYQVGGTKTPFNTPPSGPVSVNDTIDFGAVGNSVKLRDVLSTIDGPYCYMYE